MKSQETYDKLINLFERKDSAVSRMDSFQIAKEIEETVFTILNDIFGPYPVERIYEKGFGHMPDGMIRFKPLGKRKNYVFLEVKSRSLADYDFKEIGEMLRELHALYKGQFFSLVVVAKSFRQKEKKERLVHELYSEEAQFISAETLIALHKFVSERPEFRDIAVRDLFLKNLLERRGVLYTEEIRSFDIPMLMVAQKEFSHEVVINNVPTRDGFHLDLSAFVRVSVSDVGLFTEQFKSIVPVDSDRVKERIIHALQEEVRQASLLNFELRKRQTHSTIMQNLSHRLLDYGLQLSDLELNFEYSRDAQEYIEQSERVMTLEKSILSKLKDVRSELYTEYERRNRRLNDLRNDLDSVTSKYIGGKINDRLCIQRMSSIEKKIAQLKEEWTPQRS